MKKILRLVIALVLITLTSCRYEPIGLETTIGRIKMLYAKDAIKEFTFVEKGSWILVELTDEAIASKKYSNEIKQMISRNKISKESDFRFMVKVISIEQFVSELKDTTGKAPFIRKTE